MDTELAQALLAGWLSGAAAGLAGTGVLLVLVARRPTLADRLPLQHRLPVLGIVFANALTIVLTLVGLVLGALYHRTGADGIGGTFSLALAAGLAAIAVLYAFVRGRIRSGEAPAVLVLLALAGLAFGVMLPWLAEIES